MFRVCFWILELCDGALELGRCIELSSHQLALCLWLSIVGRCRHRLSVSSECASMGSCHSHSTTSPHLVSGVLSDHVGVNEIVIEQARRKSNLSSKNSLIERKSSTSHAQIGFCKRNVNQLIENQSPRKDTPGPAQVLKVGTKLYT